MHPDDRGWTLPTQEQRSEKMVIHSSGIEAPVIKLCDLSEVIWARNNEMKTMRILDEVQKNKLIFIELTRFVKTHILNLK